MTRKKLYRSRNNAAVGGVIAGFVKYYDWNIDLSLARILFVLIALISNGIGIILYIVAWIIIPIEPFGLEDSYEDIS